MKRKTLGDRLKEFYFTFDLRTLGFFRIVFGILLIHDWWTRWPDLEAFYTSFGSLPIEAAVSKAGGAYHFSLIDFATSLVMVKLVFFIGLFCYVFFLIGYRTKVFQVLSFLFLVSVLNRNILIRDGSDLVMVSIFFWTLFLPLGQKFSLDSLLSELKNSPPLEQTRPPAPPMRSKPSLAAFAIIVQLASLYFYAALDKYGADWRNGTALYYALEFKQMAGPLAVYALQLPLFILKYLTWGTLVIEYAYAPMVLFPTGQPWLRRAANILTNSLQLGIWLLMDIGQFEYVMWGISTLLFMPQDWDLLKRWALRWSRPAVVYYDDGCGFCYKCCQILSSLDSGRNLTFIGASRKDLFKHPLGQDDLRTSVVVFDAQSGEKYVQSRAFARIFQALPFPFYPGRFTALPGIRNIGDRIYALVSGNRHKISSFCGLRACGLSPGVEPPAVRPPNPGDLAKAYGRFKTALINLAVAWCFFAVLLDGYDVNFAPSCNLREIPEPPSMQAFLQAAQMIQNWFMFAPVPARDSGWWVIDGQTVSGRAFDPLTARQPDFKRAYEAPALFDRFWRKYLFRLWLRDYSDYRLYFGRYVTRKNHRDKPPGEWLKTFDFYYMLQTTQPPGTPQPWPVEKILLWHHECFAK